MIPGGFSAFSIARALAVQISSVEDLISIDQSMDGP
jgi:hypothetical protein